MESHKNVILPVSQVEEAAALLPFARSIAQAWGGRVLLFGVVCINADKSLSEGAVPAQELRRGLGEMAASDPLVDMLPTARVGYRAWDEIASETAGRQADLLILPWCEDGHVFGADLQTILAQPPCDVAVVRPGACGPVRRILLPLRGGPHAELALRVALALAQPWNAEITALHAVSYVSRPPSDAPFINMVPVLEELPAVSRILTMREPALAGIVTEAMSHDILVMGATARPNSTPEALGAVTDRVFRHTLCTAIAVKTRHEMPRVAALPLQPAAAPAGQTAISVLVDKWFAENSFHSHEFENLQELVRLKNAQGLTISLGLPALNEEKTVGRVISVCKRELMEKVPLLDEIVLIDSQSADRTRAIGKELGVAVHVHQEILPQYGLVLGKGEALWKSLHVLQGDIIAWIDTDITNIHPRFVYGVLGPLLREPRIQYVKGFYRRPLRVGNKLQAGGGGRVTELVARPMLNLFYPELSGLVQPLSGEYAGRRSALEQLPFFTGYGVETGLLIDMLDKYGLGAIAQVDLEERVHKNQELQALSKMSFQILQVFVRRLEGRHGPMLAEVNKTMKLVQHEDDRFCLDVEDIREVERPPIIDLPEYRAAHYAPLEQAA